MITDFRVLLGIRLRHAKNEAIYWLRVLGYDPTSNGLYRAYILLFWVVWAFLMWNYVVDTVGKVSFAIPDETIATVVTLIPPLLFALPIFYLVAMLRNQPVKLTAPEMNFIVSAPTHRGAIVMTHYISSVLLPSLGIAAVSSMLAMLLKGINNPDPLAFGFAGLWAMVVTLPIALTSAALVWSVVLFKLNPAFLKVRWLFWIVPLLLVGAAALVPQVFLVAGTVWQEALESRLTLVEGGLLVGATVASLALLLFVGERLHMTIIADDSRTYARIHSLGLLGRMYAQELVAQIGRQSQLMRKKNLRLKIPLNAFGEEALRYRALLSMFRLAPAPLIRPVLQGAFITALIMLVVIFSGPGAAQTWILVLIIILFVRPRELVTSFRQDVGQVFMSQLMPYDLSARFFAAELVPLGLTFAGSLAVFLLYPTADVISGIILIGLAVVGLGIAQALEIVEDATIVFRRIPYAYTVLIGGGLVLLVGALLQSVVAAVIALSVVDAIIASLLASSRE